LGQTTQRTTTSTSTTPPPLPTVFIPGTLTLNETLELTAGHSNQTLAFEPWSPQEMSTGECRRRFEVPVAPTQATDLNGIALPPVCYPESTGPRHVFVIGDWGGVSSNPGAPPVPADHRSKFFPAHHREFVVGADNCAQQNVAAQMINRSLVSLPDYIINVGDNFYWGGVQVKCGAPPFRISDATGQWERVFESIYVGPGLNGKQWLGVLGNHDYGGYLFTNGWDQAISYTWMQGGKSSGRWMTPALYWKVKVHYADFAMDYYFTDSNVFDAFSPMADPHHNICSKLHNPERGATCGLMGPATVEECPQWFKRLWNAQVRWLETGLSQSTADWQIVVTHFPPEHGHGDWARISKTYGVDLLITGHRHQQEVHYMEESNFLRPTAYIVSGGGGGITSEATPDANGTDDQYGFMDLTLTKQEIMIEAISHGGQIRSTTCIVPRYPYGKRAEKAVPSLCDGRPSGPQLPTTTTATPGEDGFGGDGRLRGQDDGIMGGETSHKDQEGVPEGMVWALDSGNAKAVDPEGVTRDQVGAAAPGTSSSIWS